MTSMASIKSIAMDQTDLMDLLNDSRGRLKAFQSRAKDSVTVLQRPMKVSSARLAR